MEMFFWKMEIQARSLLVPKEQWKVLVLWILTIEMTPRTPDCSPIENVPNHIDRQLKEDPFALKITHKSHNNFLGRLHKSMYKQLSRQPADN